MCPVGMDTDPLPTPSSSGKRNPHPLLSCTAVSGKAQKKAAACRFRLLRADVSVFDGLHVLHGSAYQA